MEGFKFLKNFRRLVPFLAIVLMIFSIQVSGQISTACSSAMLSSFSPCINFMSNNGSGSPTSACCQSLKELTASGKDCLCLIVTGNVPFKIPNRNVAITLPKACNKDSVPIECKGSSTPLPAQGPAALSPSGSPRFRNPRPPQAPSPDGDDVPEPFNPPLGPGGDTTPGLTPPSPSGGGLGNPYNGFSPPSLTDDGSGNTDTGSGFRPNLTPSSAPDSRRLPIFVVLVACGAIVLNLY